MRIPLAVLILLIATGGAMNAQVLNTAGTLSPGQYRLAVAPLIFNGAGENDGALHLQAGAGLAPGLDGDVTIGLSRPGGDTYLGLELEWLLSPTWPRLAATFGVHSQRNAGLDGALNLTIPAGRSVRIYGALDADLEFRDGENDLQAWGVVGADVPVAPRSALAFEAAFGLGAGDPDIIGVCLAWYF